MGGVDEEGGCGDGGEEEVGVGGGEVPGDALGVMIDHGTGEDGSGGGGDEAPFCGGDGEVFERDEVWEVGGGG